VCTRSIAIQSPPKSDKIIEENRNYDSGGSNSVDDSNNLTRGDPRCSPSGAGEENPRLSSESARDYIQRIGDGSPRFLDPPAVNLNIRSSLQMNSGIDLEKGRLGKGLNADDGISPDRTGSRFSVWATRDDAELWKSLLDKPATTYVGKYVQKVLKIQLHEYQQGQKRAPRRIVGNDMSRTEEETLRREREKRKKERPGTTAE
jgi:hypothetical protein